MSEEVEIYSNYQNETQAVTVIESQRAVQQVQAAVVLAKKFPRDITRSTGKILESCKRKTLADVACYEYPRGGKTITGPSIRLAEMMAQNWGNLDFGVMELEQRNGESTVMAYCWDLETNTRQSKIFQVKHERFTKQGIVKLSDPRDIYEMVANLGARRLRACILGIIPGDIVDSAVDECDKTLAGKNTTPLIDRIKSMVEKFKDVDVTQADLETFLQHKADECTEREIIRLGKVFNTLKDGGKKSDFFTPASVSGKDIPPTKAEKKKAVTPPVEAPMPLGDGPATQEDMPL